MDNAPKIFQDEFSITRGSATFRLIWSGEISPEDKQDIYEWLTLIERRIRRLPEPSPTPPRQDAPQLQAHDATTVNPGVTGPGQMNEENQNG